MKVFSTESLQLSFFKSGLCQTIAYFVLMQVRPPSTEKIHINKNKLEMLYPHTGLHTVTHMWKKV